MPAVSDGRERDRGETLDQTAAVSADLEKVIAYRGRVLDEAVAAARRDSRVRAFVLVGSLAAGTEDAYSDIDIAVIPEADGLDSLLADRRAWPAQLGDVVLQLDSSWNVWSGASQVLTLLDGELPLWVDMDIWPSVPGIPRDARVLAGDAPPPIDMTLAELAAMLKQRHGVGQVGSPNGNGVSNAAQVAWGLKGVARGHRSAVAPLRRALDQPWAPELARAGEALRRYGDHVGIGQTPP